MRTSRVMMMIIMIVSSVCMIVVGLTITEESIQTKLQLVRLGVLALTISIALCSIFEVFKSTTK